MKRQRFLMVGGALSAVYVLWMLLEGASTYQLIFHAAALGLMLAAAAGQTMIALVCAGVTFLMEAYSTVTTLVSIIRIGASVSTILNLLISGLPVLLISGMWLYALLQGRNVSTFVLLLSIAAAVFYFVRVFYLHLSAGFGLKLSTLISAVRSALPFAAYALAARWALSPRA